MAKTAKKAQKKVRAGNSARSARKTARGKPFAKGNPFAFKPGRSGNPAGRPRDTITPHLRELVRMLHPGKDEVTYGELVAQALLTRAMDGDVQAIREVFDRLEGKPRQAIDVNVEEKRRAIFDAGLNMLKQSGLSEEDAARLLTTIYPEASEWVN
jgi:hypothetical protein